MNLDLDGFNGKDLAFAANGPHHYEWEWWIGKVDHNGNKITNEAEAKATLKYQQDLDLKRREICDEYGVTLIEISYKTL